MSNKKLIKMQIKLFKKYKCENKNIEKKKYKLNEKMIEKNILKRYEIKTKYSKIKR
jgi:hypothetical protein